MIDTLYACGHYPPTLGPSGALARTLTGQAPSGTRCSTSGPSALVLPADRGVPTEMDGCFLPNFGRWD